MTNSVRPHRQQPTRLPTPWDSPGKNTAVGCHFLLQCMKVKSKSEGAQSCPTPSNSMDCRPPGSSVHGIFQARVLGWVAIAFSFHVLVLLYTLEFLLLCWYSRKEVMASVDCLYCYFKEDKKIKKIVFPLDLSRSENSIWILFFWPSTILLTIFIVI